MRPGPPEKQIAQSGEAEILAWLRPLLLRSDAFSPDDIFGSLRYAGDDGDALMTDFADRFGVDLSAFNPWLYYIADEPPGRRRWHAVDPVSGEELPLFPVSLRDLIAAAASGTWNKAHAPHRFEKNPRFSPFMIRTACELVLYVLAVALFVSLTAWLMA